MNEIKTISGKISESDISKIISSQDKFDVKSFGDSSLKNINHNFSTKFKNSIFSEKKARELLETQNIPESFFIYYVPQKEWESILYKKYPDKLLKLHSKLFELHKQKEFLNDFFKNKFKNNENKNVFVDCPRCESSINVKNYIKRFTFPPGHCPICGDNHNGTFLDLWLNKMYGIQYTYKKNRISKKEEQVYKKIKEIDSKLISEISVDSSHFEKVRSQIRTLICIKSKP